ncbi:hypothetical protein ACFYXC_41535 [Streptomyces sp. NPDC002701]
MPFLFTVTRRDGSTAHFTVTGINEWAFPSQDDYGSAVTVPLRLIPCAD